MTISSLLNPQLSQLLFIRGLDLFQRPLFTRAAQAPLSTSYSYRGVLGRIVSLLGAVLSQLDRGSAPKITRYAANGVCTSSVHLDSTSRGCGVSGGIADEACGKIVFFDRDS